MLARTRIAIVILTCACGTPETTTGSGSVDGALHMPDAAHASDDASSPDAATDPNDFEIEPGRTVLNVALQYAPIWYHDVANGGPDGLGPRADYPTNVDYDGDLQHNNNWDNLVSSIPRSYIYFGLVATPTHFFISYAQYHPRDWEVVCTGVFTECHEGDMEAVRLVVERGPTERVVAVTSEAHGSDHLWTTENSTVSRRQGGPQIDGLVDFESIEGDIGDVATSTRSHVRIFVQAHGHGPIPCRASDYEPTFGYLGFGINGVRCTGAADEGDFPGGDGIVFVPAHDSVAFVTAQTSGQRVGYQLLNVHTTLWQWRDHIGNNELWHSGSERTYWGARDTPAFAFDQPLGVRFSADQFLNDQISGNSLWSETRQGSNWGDMFFDPAYAWAQLLAFANGIDDNYVYHPYVL